MTDMIIQSIGGIAAVYGFARILGVPKKFYLWAGIDGGIGWFVYLLVGAMTHSELLGAFFGAAVISVGANVCADDYVCIYIVTIFKYSSFCFHPSLPPINLILPVKKSYR